MVFVKHRGGLIDTSLTYRVRCRKFQSPHRLDYLVGHGCLLRLLISPASRFTPGVTAHSSRDISNFPFRRI
jgi:hypothetical protein